MLTFDLDFGDILAAAGSEGPSVVTFRLRDQTVKLKPVRRLLRGDNLLCIRKRQFSATTDSNHGRQVYPNLAAEMTPSGVDQFWVADITSIRLQEEFVSLAVILDACSRRVIGWALDQTMEDELMLAAFEDGSDPAPGKAGPSAPFRPGITVCQQRLLPGMRAERGQLSGIH